MSINSVSMNSGYITTISSSLQQVENDQTLSGGSNSAQDATAVGTAMSAFEADTLAGNGPAMNSSQYWQVMTDFSHVGSDVTGASNNFSSDMQQLSADLASAVNLTITSPTASGSMPSVSISGETIPLITALYELLQELVGSPTSSGVSSSGASGVSSGSGTVGSGGTILAASGSSGATSGSQGISSGASATASAALATFDADAGGMALDGASNNNANQALKAQIDQAVSAGDKTSFEAAKTTILGMLSATGANTSSIQSALFAIEQNTTWSANGGAAVIGTALTNAGNAAGNGDWNNSNGPATLSTFTQAFNSRSSTATLEYDAAQVEANLNPQSIVGHDITTEMQQALAYADGGYNIGKDPANYAIQSSWGNMSPADINPTVSSALAAFSSNAGAMYLTEGAANGKANQALMAQVVAAVNAGDQTSFNGAYNAIIKAMGAPSAGQNSQVLASLNTLSSDTPWKTDGGKAVIATNIQNAANALAASDWQSGANPADVATFISDFNAGVPYSTLSSDASKIAGDLNSTDLSTNLSAMVTQALNYAQNDPNYNPKNS
jgi:hypothetical protein